MKKTEYYEYDLSAFFEGKLWERQLFDALAQRMEVLFPEASVKVQKTQVSFYGRHLFAAVSLPLRRKKEWPEKCILVTFGLGACCLSSRVAMATEPYPNRWTHHIVISQTEQLDKELMGWLQEAWDFAERKR